MGYLARTSNGCGRSSRSRTPPRSAAPRARPCCSNRTKLRRTALADLSILEKRQLERVLQMGSGYLLNFSDRTFQEFVADSVGRDICDLRYNYASGSKANRMRG